MVEWLAGNRIRGTSTERTTTTGIVKGYAGWKEVGRTTWSAGSAISVTGLEDKRYYMILSDTTQSAAGDHYLQFNGDVYPNTNYSGRRSTNGATDTTAISTAEFEANDQTGGGDVLGVSHWSNLATKEKLGLGHFVSGSTAGAAAPYRSEFAMKWANTSTAISSYQHKANSNFSRGEVVVLGWDPTDTHTANFWEELASVELGSAGDNLSSGTITAKKYLWFQAYIIPTGGSANCNLTFNNDTDQNYSLRYTEGTNEPTLTGERLISMDVAKKSTPFFINGFVINNSANEKLTIIHQMNQSTATAGYAPTRNEIVGKWSNTSSVITEIDIDNPQVGVDYAIGSMLKVWGSN
jgi:hypothetical protein